MSKTKRRELKERNEEVKQNLKEIKGEKGRIKLLYLQES